jgi:hypothetical protein
VKTFVVDVVGAIEAPGVETAPTVAELLEHGTANEVREALQSVGILIRHGRPLSADVARLVGLALERIGEGMDPRQAFGLTTKKKHGVRYHKAMTYLIGDLVRQGATKQEAERLVADLDLRTLRLRRDVTGGTAADRLRKRLVRSPTK